MRKRRLMLGAFGLVSIVALVFVVMRVTSRPRIDETAFQRIEHGMTLEEVEALLGGPPGNYSEQGKNAAYIEVTPTSGPPINAPVLLPSPPITAAMKPFST